jgi:uncharacterized membrane protein
MQTPVETQQEEHIVYEFFLWSVLLKLAISLIEVVSGIALFFIAPERIVLLGMFLLNHLPIAALQRVLLGELSHYTEGTVTFVALYLLSRGFVKLVLLGAVLKKQLIAYPASLLVLGAFLVYQLYQIATSGSLIVTAITLFDIVVMYFIYREWRILARQLHSSEVGA